MYIGKGCEKCLLACIFSWKKQVCTFFLFFPTESFSKDILSEYNTHN